EISAVIRGYSDWAAERDVRGLINGYPISYDSSRRARAQHCRHLIIEANLFDTVVERIGDIDTASRIVIHSNSRWATEARFRTYANQVTRLFVLTCKGSCRSGKTILFENDVIYRIANIERLALVHCNAAQIAE